MVKKIFACNGPTCSVMGSESVVKKLSELAVDKENEYEISTCACMGHCQSAPNVAIDGEIIENVQLENIENDVLLGQGRKAKKVEDYNAEELIKDDFLNDI